MVLAGIAVDLPVPAVELQAAINESINAKPTSRRAILFMKAPFLGSVIVLNYNLSWGIFFSAALLAERLLTTNPGMDSWTVRLTG
jgi:hypothetical protein